MKPIYGDNSLRLRAAKLAARPKCGHRWTTGRSDVWRHACVKGLGHYGRDHRCQCGVEKRKAVKR